MIFQGGATKVKNHQNMKKILVQLAFKTHFLTDSGYPKFQFRVPDPFTILYTLVIIYKLPCLARISASIRFPVKTGHFLLTCLFREPNCEKVVWQYGHG